MRLLLLTPALALAIAACGKSDTEAQNAGSQLTAEAISSNDVTAIDAVTGEAANMAEDVDFTAEMNNGADGLSPTRNGSAPRRRQPQGRASVSSPASNTAAPASAPEPAEPQSNAQ